MSRKVGVNVEIQASADWEFDDDKVDFRDFADLARSWLVGVE